MTLGQSLPIPGPQFPHLPDGITIYGNSGITHSGPSGHHHTADWYLNLFGPMSFSKCFSAPPPRKPFSSGRCSPSKEQVPLQPPDLSSPSSAGQPPGAWALAASSCPWLLPCPSSPKHYVAYVTQPNSVTWWVDLSLLSHLWGHLSGVSGPGELSPPLHSP